MLFVVKIQISFTKMKLFLVSCGINFNRRTTFHEIEKVENGQSTLAVEPAGKKKPSSRVDKIYVISKTIEEKTSLAES